jgi:RNA polymerase sigma-B factor
MTPRSTKALRPAGESERCARLRRDRELFERCRDPSSSVNREAIVRRFMPLARQLAARYARGSEPFDDLFQVACLALVRAVDRYDTERQTAFSSFAVPTILGELKRHFRDKTWSVRVPRDLQELSLAVERESEWLTATLGRAPTVDEVAEAVDAGADAVLDARGAIDGYHALSLDDTRSNKHEDDDEPLLAGLGGHDIGFSRVEDRAALDALLRHLTRRERAVVALRFEADLTQTEIGARLGISQMQVSRLLRASLARLREMALVETPPDMRRAA